MTPFYCRFKANMNIVYMVTQQNVNIINSENVEIRVPKAGTEVGTKMGGNT